ncbi:sulfotransferase family protein [Marinitenerispora sediminis]|uniref:Sulfotransferase family protein n=1 Tax=Marinitenerispora sediminis TaxID=1931232 RepID=A0A368T674_9ACTN|nr:hypothetical protein [Marinitenerispora sediminis]RCV51855.1 hypothetical protein DEF28_14385 [Marinitenerispora sediminis]RCV54822.1 hypothetical protein DEF23_15320 [Marinitenerispora sediminis]RCV58968.1 hypothetical protein DEF24_11640 [Marinitenerispora sediminis]
MIVLHSQRLVFVRTRKTAGTSIEIALSRLAGRDDIVTALSPRDEDLRRVHGGCGPQNHLAPGAAPGAGKHPGPGVGVAWWNHMPLSLIQDRMDLSGYTTMAVDRHPAEKVLSLYYHRHRAEPRTSLEDFVASGEAADALNWPLYTRGGRVGVDVLIRYERLTEGLAHLSDRVGLPRLELGSVRAKAHFRPPGTGRDLFTPAARRMVEAVFGPEFALHDYTWEDPC